MCRICILIKEMLERVESLDTLECTGMYWNVWNVWNDWKCLECPCRTGMPVEGLAAGMPCRLECL